MLGSICSQFHWTVEYLMWGVNWPMVQMMLADMPWYDYGKSEKKGKHNEISLDDMDPEGLKNLINRLNG